MTRPIAAAVGVYAFLLRFYPPAFRRDFAPGMIEDFRDLSRDAAAASGTELAREWLHAAADLLPSIAWQWMRAPAGWTGLAAIAGALVCLEVLGRLARYMPAGLDLATRVDDLTLFSILVLGALFPIASVIVFGWWFLTPALRRPGRGRA